MVTSHIRKSIGKMTSLEMPASSSWSTHITASEFKRPLSGLWCQASLHSVLWDRQLMAPQLIAVGTRTGSILISKEGEAFWSYIVSKKHHGEVSATDSRLAVKRLHAPPTPTSPPPWIIFPQTLLTDVIMMSESGISQSMNFFFELLWEVVLRLWKSSKTAAHEINSWFFFSLLCCQN